MAKSDHVEVVVEEILIKKIAGMSATGLGVKDIAQSLGMTPVQVRAVMDREDFRECAKRVGDEFLVEARSKMKVGVAAMVDRAVQALWANLEKENLEAVKLVYKALSIGEEKESTGDTTIQVLLPGAKAKEEIEVHATVQDRPAEK